MEGNPLRKQRLENAARRHTTIEHLAAELLQAILLQACSPAGQDPDLLAVRKGQATFWSCVLVCRTWRDAALDFSELWSIAIDFERFSIPRLRRLLQLSHPHPFNVGHLSALVPIGPQAPGRSRLRFQGLIDLLVHHVERVRELHVQWAFDGSFIQDESYASLLRLDMPRLEALSWVGTGPVGGLPARWWAGSQVDMPISWRRLPSLRRCAFNSSAFKLGTQLPVGNMALTEFSCVLPHYQQNPSGRLATFAQLRSFLQCTPYLRFLEVDCAIKTQPLPAPQTLASSPIILPNLILAKFFGKSRRELDVLIRLFCSITGHWKCGLVVGLSGRTTQLSHDWLRAKINDVLESHPTSDMTLHLDVEADGKFTIGNIRNPKNTLDWIASGGEAVSAKLNALNPPVVSFWLEDVATREDYGHAFSVWEPAIALTKTLHVEGIRWRRLPNFSIMWVSTMRSFTDVTTLVLDHAAADTLLRTMLGIGRDYAAPLNILEPTQSQIIGYFPYLRTLTLDSCDLSSRSYLAIYLGEFLKTRASISHPLAFLHLTKPYFVSCAKDADLSWVQSVTLGKTKLIYTASDVDTLEYRSFCRRL